MKNMYCKTYTKYYILLLVLISQTCQTNQKLTITSKPPLDYCLGTVLTPLKYSLTKRTQTILISLSSHSSYNEAVVEVLMKNSTKAVKIFKRNSNEQRIFLQYNTKNNFFLFVVTNFEDVRTTVDIFKNQPCWVRDIQIYILYVANERVGRSQNESDKDKLQKRALKTLKWLINEKKVYVSMAQIVSLNNCRNETPINNYTQLYSYEPFPTEDVNFILDGLREIPYPDSETTIASGSSHWKRMRGHWTLPVNLKGLLMNISFFWETYMGKLPNSTNPEDYDQHITEMQMIRMMKEYMNVTPVIIQPSDDGNFGSCSNDVCTGSLKDVVEQKVEMSLNLRFIKQYNTSKIDFSMPIIQDSLCIAVPDVGYINGIYLILSLYTFEVWLFFIISATTSMVFHKVMSHFAHKLSRNGQNLQKKDTVLPPLKALVGIPFKITQIFSLRLQIITCMFVSIIYISLWQGAMFHMARYGQKGKNIETLAELSDSGRVIFTSYSDLLDTFEGFEKPPLNELKDRLRLKPNVEQDIPKVLKEAHSGVLVRQNMFNMNKELKPEKYSQIKIHMVQECIRKYQLAYIAPKGAPSVKLFKLFMNRIRETGIYEHLVREYVRKEQLKRAMTKREQAMNQGGEEEITEDEYLEKGNEDIGKGEPTALSLRSLSLPFLIMQVGYMISIVVFVMEILMARYKRRTVHPRLRGIRHEY